MRTSSTFSILFWVYTKRAIKNKTNIYVRITVDGQRVNISLKRKIDITTWDEKLQRASGRGKDARILNQYLNDVQTKIQRIYEQFQSEGIGLNSQMIKARFLGEDKNNLSFLGLIVYYNEKMQHKLHKNTMVQYKTSQRYMSEFIFEEFHTDDIPLQNSNIASL